jgi:hypothetical protein
MKRGICKRKFAQVKRTMHKRTKQMRKANTHWEGQQLTCIYFRYVLWCYAIPWCYLSILYWLHYILHVYYMFNTCIMFDIHTVRVSKIILYRKPFSSVDVTEIPVLKKHTYSFKNVCSKCGECWI